MYPLLDTINFILALIAIVYVYGTLIRTTSDFYKSVLYIMTSVMVLGAVMLLRVLHNMEIIMIEWPVFILEMWFLVMFIVGFWHLNHCVKKAGGEDRLKGNKSKGKKSLNP